jgi:hypothetical protein
MRLLWCAPLLLLSGALGCTRVEPADVAGTWVIREASRHNVPTALRRASGRIVFDRSGTFTAAELPALFGFPGRRPARLESGSGTWKIASRDGEPRVELVFQDIADWDSKALPFQTPLFVSGRSSSLQLYYFLGDPDDGSTVAFEKQ